VLAGLNRLYYSTFQFKRMRRFVAAMGIAPAALADRIEAMLVAEPAAAIAALERLVGEVVDLVERHMPEADTAAVRRALARRDTVRAAPADESIAIRPPRAGGGPGPS
jgi:hypothetical protein